MMRYGSRVEIEKLDLVLKDEEQELRNSVANSCELEDDEVPSAY